MKHIVYWLTDRLSTSQLEALAYQVVSRRAGDLSAKESLAMLFRLDTRFYSLQGKKAVEFGGGLHPKYRVMSYRGFFVNQIRHDEKVLDIGCSFGAVAFEVAEKSAAHVLGMDLDSDFIDKARQLYPHPRVEYRVGDALQELPDGPFDVVILSNVLEHLPGRPAFLRRVVETARPERILIRVPLFERDWRVPLKKELGVEWRLDPTHETEYTLESFRAEMMQAGLSISHQEVRWGEIWAVVVPTVPNLDATI